MKHKKLFISLTVVLAVLLFLGSFLLIWFVGDTYPDFEKFRKEFAIEGLDDGAVPQGLGAYYAQYEVTDADGKTSNAYQQYFLMSAYMKDGSPSRIYVTAEKTGYVGSVMMKNLDGSLHDGHVGGIATNGSRLWVTYGDSILVAQASEEYKNANILREIVAKAEKNSNLEDGEEEETIQFTASFKANCNAAFLYYYHDPRYSTVPYDRLYVGEFYRKGNYETDKSHRLETPNGYKNTAFMYEYQVNANSTNAYGLDLIDSSGSDKTICDANGEPANVPKILKIYSLPEQVQGIAFSGRGKYGTTEGTLVLSQSYGLSNSHLLCFDWNKMHAKNTKYTELSENNASFVYNGVFRTDGANKSPYTDSTLNVYFADKNDSNSFINDYSVPSMSEGMCTVVQQGNSKPTQTRIYVLFESGGKKYNLFTRESIKNVYSFIPKAS